MICSDGEEALYGLATLRTLVKANVNELSEADRIVFGNRGAEIRLVDNALRSHTYTERLSSAQSSQHGSFSQPPASQSELPMSESRVTITLARKVRKAYLLHESYKIGWLLDGCASKCFACKTLFSISKRRHHCRACGNIFCSKCSDKRVFVNKLKLRVCTLCHIRLDVTMTNISLQEFLRKVTEYDEHDHGQYSSQGVVTSSKLEKVEELDKEDITVLGQDVDDLKSASGSSISEIPSEINSPMSLNISPSLVQHRESDNDVNTSETISPADTSAMPGTPLSDRISAHIPFTGSSVASVPPPPPELGYNVDSESDSKIGRSLMEDLFTGEGKDYISDTMPVTGYSAEKEEEEQVM